MKIQVTMTETVTYSAELDVDQFADLIGVDTSPDQSVTDAARRLKKVTEDDSDGDYGVVGATELLDFMVEPSNVRLDVSAREWSFEFPDLVLVDQIAAVKAPQHDNDGWD